MTTVVKTGFCEQCDQQRPVFRDKANHILHLLLSIVTFGFWIIIWFLCAIKIGGWRCKECGGAKIKKVR